MSEQEAMAVIEDGLIVVPQASVPEIFSSVKAIETIVEMVRQEVSGHEPDLETVKGRKAIASLSSKVSKSKVLLDGLGKDLVSDIKKQASTIDAARKVARDSLDILRDETRKPLTDWELEQDRLALEEQARVVAEQKRIEEENQLLADHDSGLQENELFDLRITAKKQQDELDRQQQEKDDKEEAARVEADRVAKIEQANIDAEALRVKIAKEETERIQAEADKKISEAQEAADKKIRLAKEETDRIEAKRISDDAETRRVADIEAAAAEKKANDGRHRGKINRQALADLMQLPCGMEEADAKAVVVAIALGKVANVSIKY